MQKLVKEYLNELKRKQKKRRRIGIAAVLLIVLVAGTVIGILTQAGVAMTGDARCGLEEHLHGESCYEDVTNCGLEETDGHGHDENCYETQSILVCTAEETEEHQHDEFCYDTQNIPICGLEETDGHRHDSSCMEQQLVCGMEEHTHTDMCYIDSEADVEDASVWGAQYTQTPWTGNWGEDLATAARMQLDYEESASNYAMAEDGNRKGYTRYGQFAGDAYMDWDAAFVNFCLYYAGIQESGLFPEETDSGKWLEEFGKIREDHSAYLAVQNGYTPKAGDIVFFQRDQEESPVQMGIVTSYEEEGGTLQVIEGNSANAVKENSYQVQDSCITGYLKTTELERAYKGLSKEEDPSDIDTAAPVKNNTPQKNASAENSAGEPKPINGDEAYVNSIQVTGIRDGVAPWDETEGPGNDTGESNRKVRTFDTVTYDFSVEMKPWSEKDVYNEARVKLEFVLPLSDKEAVFDQTAMAWMDTAEGYAPELKKETRIIDGEERECQILTCYKHLIPSEGNLSVIPGNFGQNVTINVKSMKNGQTFAPIFSACMEGGTWDGSCENKTHSEIEKKTVTPESVEVTAAPKYNIQVKGNGSYTDTFDFSLGNETAANQDAGTIPGRLMKLGITLQLYNDNASKGLKGIELPQGDIAFELQLSSKYKITIPKEDGKYPEGAEIDTLDSYTPLLWSYGPNMWIGEGKSNQDGRPLYDSSVNSSNAPMNEGRQENECWRSGKWLARQEGSKIYITVQDYEIDPSHMPTRDGDNSADIYGTNIGCFSAGGLWIVQPFNKINGTGEAPFYDVVEEYGSGAFGTTVKAEKLQAETVSGVKVVEGENGFKQQKTDDDETACTLELTLSGDMHNRVRYADAEVNNRGSGIEDNRNGRDYAAVGSGLQIMAGLSYKANNEEKNQLYWGTNLCKFYGSAIELTGVWEPELTGGASLDGKTEDDVRDNIRIYYAAKKDGTDWESDYELQHTYEDEMVFYDSLEQIPEGHICVGILTCFKGPGAKGGTDPYYLCYHQAKVKENMSLAGNTYMLASTSRAWAREDYEGWDWENGEMTFPSWTEQTTTLSSFPEKHQSSANIEGSPTGTFYTKEIYKEDGSGIAADHNSDWSHYGDTLLIIGYKTKITKNLLQKDQDGNNDKKTFNLDLEQRIVDFKLQPELRHDQKGFFEKASQVTIVDTLPKYLSYKPGSAWMGGEYQQTSVNGGTQGKIIAGKDGKEPELKEPEVTKNEDGTQTLKWVLADVEIGKEMPPIYYSAQIGERGNPDGDVPTATTALENKVYITSPEDRREPTVENGNFAKEGIDVTRGTASSFGKYTRQKVVDEDGEIDYVVYFNNNADTNSSVAMVDTMPAAGKNNSHFTGTYEFKAWKLDVSKCDPNKIEIYYTYDKKYENKPENEVTADIITEGTWTQAQIDSEGKIALPDTSKDQMHPTAWAVIGELEAHKSINVELKIKLDPGASDAEKKDNNYFVNLLTSGTTTTITETPTVRRTLEGLTWMDDDHNGIQNEIIDESSRISGIRVELLQLEEGKDPAKEDSYKNVCYPGTKTPIQIETGKQISVRATSEEEIIVYEKGRYKFTDLPAGTFAVRFTDGTTNEAKITKLHASKTDCGSDDTRDSDGVPVYDSDGNLKRTVILNLKMPRAEELSVALYESKFHDSGFYPDTVIHMEKRDETGNRRLTGAVFTIKDSKGSLISFTSEEDGSYTVFRDDGVEAEAQGYYIACAANPDYVLGFGGDWNGVEAVLQRRTGSAWQIFEVLKGNDFTCFRQATSKNQCIDLADGKTENGNKIQLYQEEPFNISSIWQTKKWVITENQDGTISISSKNDANKVISLDRNSCQENAKVCLWDKSDNEKLQKWLLIPTENRQDTETRMDLPVNTDGRLTINDLAPGDYTIEEIKSPDGYTLLKEPVKITLNREGTISMKESNSMAQIEETDTGLLLAIRNSEFYELPSTGGTGIYWYTIGGMLLMMGASLILYKNRCKEVLKR